MAGSLGQTTGRTTIVACLNSSSIFTAIEQHFTALTAHLHEPLTLPAPNAAGSTTPALTLPEARAFTRDLSNPLEQRDQIWRELITHARTTPDPWALAATWMLLPALKSATRRLCHTTRLDIADLRSALITGFLEALATINPGRGNLGAALYWSAYNAARATCRPHRHVGPTDEIDRIAAYITDTTSHIHRGVLDTTHIGHLTLSQLEGERLGSIAHRMGVTDHLHHSPSCRHSATQLHHRSGPHGRRVVLRVCSTPLYNIAKVPTHPIDHTAEHR
jgi:hypothetical protein